MTKDAPRVLAELERRGLLLLQDKELPSVATLLAGEPISGSWWGHAAGSRIFHALEAIEDTDAVVFCRLLAGKVTLVSGALVPALCAAGSERAAWQIEKLSTAARELLGELDAAGSLRATGASAKELELRLLAAGKSVHTESGAHATELSTWDVLRRSRKIRRVPTAEAGRSELEAAARAIGAPDRALPWLKSPPRRRPR